MLLTATLVAALALLARPPSALAADKMVESNKVADDDPFTWLTDDAVVIESAASARGARQAWPGVLPAGPCFSTQGRLGQCTSFRACYPFFKLPDFSTWETWVLGVFDTCSYFGDTGRQMFGVCCTEPQTRPPGAVSTPGLIPVAPIEPQQPQRPQPVPVVPVMPVQQAPEPDTPSIGNPVPAVWPPEVPTHPPEMLTHPPLPTHPPSLGVPTSKPPAATTEAPTTTTRRPRPPLEVQPVVVQPPPSQPAIPPNWPPPLPTHPPATTMKPVSTLSPWPGAVPTAKPLPKPTTKPPATALPLPGPTPAPEPMDASCGAKNGYQDQERIVGGQNADIGEWPWIAALFNGGRQFCGGSLIDSTHILSAAHCVAHMSSWDVARLTVRLGDHNIRTNSETKHIEKKVRRVVRHRGFDSRTLYNDVAILTLDSPVQFRRDIRPICMPSGSAAYAGKTATVIGWGSLRESGPQPAVLQEVNIPVWTNAECRQKYGNAAPGGIVDTFLCAGQASRDSCSGDSGGPLMVNDGRWVQVGIVSWGIGCGKGQYPGVYSRVTSFMPWIQKNLK
ncbi:serine proteinase stubble-like [Thrips palmi]|uniref:Phenoloxidase-activating factor 2 n=1 Tax=Thrips palmi TaxID=161013 RepID=A0A6P8YKH6_THRPL|nr:serine proteinase stubble-like [Thrips palmi]